MADTAIPLTNVAPGVVTNDIAGTAIVAANTHVITLPRDVTPEEVIVRIVNTFDGEKVATITAGAAPPSTTGEAQPTAVTLADGSPTPTVAFVGLSSRHLQSNGTIVITVAAAMTGTITAFRLKRV